ncbi:MAG: thiamine pyrophosphate-dependent dehydrogenase E1 component subunit alpha [Methylococcales bacterium]|nr:thiamine pyrophosphate-dependent dehydrogenase E1 component subunit alpha [Methylococcales bacterium]MBT7444573.1 thiamine pyrophosphate-dependent dehydrogenase E1 component subunit alpha [Methylococcales bacterium]
MLRIRRIEEKIESRYHEDEMKSPIHLVIGQEASSVGSCAALSDTDLIYSTHRTHGNYLAKGGDLKAMMSELYCRANGCVGSRGGSMHLLDKSVGMAGSSAIVGGIVPIATGTALSAKIRRSDMVTGVYFGDGAVEEGSIWESLNFAALKKLPVIYFCENNFYSVCTPLDKRQPEGVKIYKKAEAFGLRSEQIDGTNVLSVYESTKRAVSLVRAGNGPMFIEMLAYRWRGHGGAGDDSHTGYRDVAEGAQWHQFCPIETYKSALLGAGLLRESLVDDMEHVIADEIDMAFEHAINSPNPTEADLASFLYSE